MEITVYLKIHQLIIIWQNNKHFSKEIIYSKCIMDLCFSCWGEGLSVNQWVLPERMELPYVSLKKIQNFFSLETTFITRWCKCKIYERNILVVMTSSNSYAFMELSLTEKNELITSYVESGLIRGGRINQENS